MPLVSMRVRAASLVVIAALAARVMATVYF